MGDVNIENYVCLNLVPEKEAPLNKFYLEFYEFFKVMIAEALDIARECYLAILMDRETTGPIIVASPEGGVDIEEVAKKSPQSIFKVKFKKKHKQFQIQF